jgi:hypothetical protein
MNLLSLLLFLSEIQTRIRRMERRHKHRAVRQAVEATWSAFAGWSQAGLALSRGLFRLVVQGDQIALHEYCGELVDPPVRRREVAVNPEGGFRATLLGKATIDSRPLT